MVPYIAPEKFLSIDLKFAEYEHVKYTSSFLKKSLLKINHHIGLCSYKSLQKQLEMDICDSVMSNENVSIIWHYY